MASHSSEVWARCFSMTGTELSPILDDGNPPPSGDKVWVNCSVMDMFLPFGYEGLWFWDHNNRRGGGGRGGGGRVVFDLGDLVGGGIRWGTLGSAESTRGRVHEGLWAPEVCLASPPRGRYSRRWWGGAERPLGLQQLDSLASTIGYKLQATQTKGLSHKAIS